MAPGMALQGRGRVEIVNPKTVLKLYSFAGRQEGGMLPLTPPQTPPLPGSAGGAGPAQGDTWP